MYGRNVFQILQKKEYPPRTSSTMGPMSIPVQIFISQPKANCPVFIALPLYNSSPSFWKSDNDQDHDFHAVSIEGYDTNGFFFRISWGADWGNNGCGYLPFIDWSRVVEAWIGVSRRPRLNKPRVSGGPQWIPVSLLKVA